MEAQRITLSGVKFILDMATENRTISKWMVRGWFSCYRTYSNAVEKMLEADLLREEPSPKKEKRLYRITERGLKLREQLALWRTF